MRPVGPESAETYWMRRALVVGAMLVLLIIILLFLFNLGGSPGQAAPAPTRSAVPAGGPSSSAPMTSAASATPSPTPSASPTSSATDSASTSPSPSTTSSTSPSDKSSDKPSSKSSGKSSDKSSGKPSTNPSTKASTKPSMKPSTKPATVSACTSQQLWPNLKSKHHTVTAGSKVTFGIAYINRSHQPCSVKINPDDYELRISSGTDRIWSTDDCAKLVRNTATTLKPGDAVVWTITWNGKRSAQGQTCQNLPEMPRPGYYHVTSKLKGTRSLDYLLILK